MPRAHHLLDRSQLARIQRQITVTDDGCWLWNGPLTPNGYGRFRLPGQRERVVHRVLWEHHNGFVPPGQQLDHRCMTRNCCNPEHLEPVTPSENTRRQRHANRLKDACPKGHPYDEANTRIGADGKRRCRACDRKPAAATSPARSEPA